MNFMGMGFVELLVIFLVAFLALGPAKSVEMARTVGKFVREVQRTFTEITATVRLEDLERDQRQNPQQPPNPGESAGDRRRE
jgi:Sec-independent protein translocase protein TatA